MFIFLGLTLKLIPKSNTLSFYHFIQLFFKEHNLPHRKFLHHSPILQERILYYGILAIHTVYNIFELL